MYTQKIKLAQMFSLPTLQSPVYRMWLYNLFSVSVWCRH